MCRTYTPHPTHITGRTYVLPPSQTVKSTHLTFYTYLFYFVLLQDVELKLLHAPVVSTTQKCSKKVLIDRLINWLIDFREQPGLPRRVDLRSVRGGLLPLPPRRLPLPQIRRLQTKPNPAVPAKKSAPITGKCATVAGGKCAGFPGLAGLAPGHQGLTDPLQGGEQQTWLLEQQEAGGRRCNQH